MADGIIIHRSGGLVNIFLPQYVWEQKLKRMSLVHISQVIICLLFAWKFTAAIVCLSVQKEVSIPHLRGIFRIPRIPVPGNSQKPLSGRYDGTGLSIQDACRNPHGAGSSSQFQKAESNRIFN